MYLAVLEAFRARLAGHPPKHEVALGPLAQLIPSRAAPLQDFAPLVNYLHREASVSLAGMQVPIILWGIKGIDFSRVNPSLAFRCINMSPRYDEYVPPADRIKQVVENSKQTTITDPEERPRLARLRESPQGFDFFIEVQARSKDPLVSALLARHMADTLPPRTSLREPAIDGSYAVRYVLQDSYQEVESEPAAGVGQEGFAAEYLKIWVYKVRSFMDNTDTWVLEQLVREMRTTVTVNG